MDNSNDNAPLSWRNLDTLNKFIRLANITGLSFHDLTMLLTAWEELRKTNPAVPVNELFERIKTEYKGG